MPCSAAAHASSSVTHLQSECSELAQAQIALDDDLPQLCSVEEELLMEVNWPDGHPDLSI